MAAEGTEEDGELVDVSKVSVPCDIASERPVWLVMAISADSVVMGDVERLMMMPAEVSGDTVD